MPSARFVLRLALGGALPIAVALCLLWAATALGGSADNCRDCHTTPSRLVPAVRELLAGTSEMPGGSTRFAGEG
jgi:hypothetical protein